jgi:hypothetical protein
MLLIPTPNLQEPWGLSVHIASRIGQTVMLLPCIETIVDFLSLFYHSSFDLHDVLNFIKQARSCRMMSQSSAQTSHKVSLRRFCSRPCLSADWQSYSFVGSTSLQLVRKLLGEFSDLLAYGLVVSDNRDCRAACCLFDT